MVSKTSLAQWLADHVGADWLNVTRKSNDAIGANVLVTLRFNKDYCQSLVSLCDNYSSHAELHQTLMRRISQVRDEFFLLKMHALSSEEGIELETKSKE